jgi:diacylglycerol O-acyltransferase / wax synthase
MSTSTTAGGPASGPPELEATDAMLAAFSEIRSAAGLPAELTVIETATAQA